MRTVFVVGDVADVMQCLDFPVGFDQGVGEDPFEGGQDLDGALLFASVAAVVAGVPATRERAVCR